jgi:DUF4097 and DUF4098 domain-containing protein YvlB
MALQSKETHLMRNGRLMILVATLAGAILLGGCPRIPFGFNAREDYSLTADFTGIDTFKVNWVNGTVTLRIDSSATTAQVSGNKFANAPTQTEADFALLDIQITLAADPNDPGTLILAFAAPTDPTTSYGAVANITLPASVAVEIESANGDVEMSDNMAATTVALANGNIEITEQNGATNARTNNGNVTISSEGGNITADSDNGNVTVTTTDGSIVASSDNGDVTIDAQPQGDDTITATTSVGDIVMRVPADFIATFTLVSTLGNVTLVDDLAGFNNATIDTRSAGRAEGDLNGGIGGGAINATTDVGQVTLDVLP